MGEKGNLADVRPVGGHTPVPQAPHQTMGMGGQPLTGAPSASQAGAGGGGLLSDLADQAKGKVVDTGFDIVGGHRENDDEPS
ncbi:MAG TPA: hypothetical protein VGZ52_00665 [Acidimicrobiales bacterium]|jgi:hypothetical protein|nr:hypothetical protein [Acidimicrobiales bacterium]